MKDLDGKEWEFECGAYSGDIIEIEQEGARLDVALFKKKMKMFEKKARKIATDLYPVTIKEVEYEIESNGQTSYEFDIASEDTGEVQIKEWGVGELDNI